MATMMVCMCANKAHMLLGQSISQLKLHVIGRRRSVIMITLQIYVTPGSATTGDRIETEPSGPVPKSKMEQETTAGVLFGLVIEPKC